MNLKDILYNELNNDKDLINELTEIIQTSNEEFITLDETNKEIHHQVIIQYLQNHNYALTDENYNYAKQHLIKPIQDESSNSGFILTRTTQEKINHLDNFSEEDMKSLLEVSILRKLKTLQQNLQAIQQNLQTNTFYEYKIEVVYDVNGATDERELIRVINNYAQQGYRVKHIFTNELGKNSVSIAGVGINSTEDQVVVLFERIKPTT